MRASLQVKDALLASLEQNATHLPNNVRVRAVINLCVSHHAARPMTAGLLRALRDAETNRFRDFKAYDDFRDRFQIDRKYDPAVPVATAGSLQESDFQRDVAVAGPDDGDTNFTVHTPKAAPRSVSMSSSMSSSASSKPPES